jgi:hypothetical protein
MWGRHPCGCRLPLEGPEYVNFGAVGGSQIIPSDYSLDHFYRPEKSGLLHNSREMWHQGYSRSFQPTWYQSHCYIQMTQTTTRKTLYSYIKICIRA